MSRRIDVELTSARPDGTWTWRAAGAREPKGVLDGSLLGPSAKVGDTLRVDADFDIEGITILAVVPAKGARKEPERLELSGSSEPFEPVVTRLAERGRGGREGGDRRPRRDGDDRPRGDRPRGDRPRGDRPGGDRPGGDRPGGDRARGPRPQGAEAGRARGPRPEGGERGPRRSPAPSRPPVEAKPKPKRLRAGRAHRNEVLAGLPEEQRPVAEQVLRGGIPAVRAAVEEQNAKLRAEGQQEIRPEALVALAEQLLPRLRVADWLDRAEAALADAAELDLRDLRSVVSASDDMAREESARELATQLRAALAARVDAEHTEWLQEISTTLDDGRSVRALRLSSRPPKAGSRFPAELAGRLAGVASASLTPEASTERWIAVLDALAFSPVRSFVVPAGIPTTVTPELTEAVTRLASSLPNIAALFGIEPSAAGARRGPRRPPQPRRGGRPGAGQGQGPGRAPAGEAQPVVPAEGPAEDAAVAADVAPAVEPAEGAVTDAAPLDDAPGADVSAQSAVPADGADAPEVSDAPAPQADAGSQPDATPAAADEVVPQADAGSQPDAAPAEADADEGGAEPAEAATEG